MFFYTCNCTIFCNIVDLDSFPVNYMNGWIDEWTFFLWSFNVKVWVLRLLRYAWDVLNNDNRWKVMHLRGHHPLISKCECMGTRPCRRGMTHSRECHHPVISKYECKGTRLCGRRVMHSRECHHPLIIKCEYKDIDFVGQEWCTQGSVIIPWSSNASARALGFVG